MSERKPLKVDDLIPVEPSPVILQGDAPPTERSLDLTQVKTLLLHLLRHDEAVQAAVDVIPKLNVPPTEPDAALGRWIKDLVLHTLQQHLRRDAFRRPGGPA